MARYTPTNTWLSLSSGPVPIRFVRHRRARHYILRVTKDGAARVTIPPFGTRKEALAFARRHTDWFERERANQQRARRPRPAWRDGSTILLRGREVALEVDADLFGTEVRFAGHLLRLTGQPGDLRPAVQGYLRELARRELPPLVRARAAVHALAPGRVAVRNQRTLWGSCSPVGNISLNWRLVQTPDAIRDYVIIHELMHLREMNHSPRFWTLVADACPGYKEAERWLKQHEDLLKQ